MNQKTAKKLRKFTLFMANQNKRTDIAEYYKALKKRHNTFTQTKKREIMLVINTVCMNMKKSVKAI